MKDKNLFDIVYGAASGLGKIINYICLAAACLSGIGMTVCLVWGVFTRYIIGFQAIWTEELARFFLIWMTMTGCSVAWYNGNLTRFTVVLDRMPEGGRRIQEILITLLVAAYMTIFCLSGNAAMAIFKITKASVLKFSLKYVAAGLYLGAAAMVYHCIPKLMLQIKDTVVYFKSKKESTGEVN